MTDITKAAPADREFAHAETEAVSGGLISLANLPAESFDQLKEVCEMLTGGHEGKGTKRPSDRIRPN